MKFLFLFFALLSLSLCDPLKINKLTGAEDVFTNVKRTILECISKAENTTPELRKYVTDLLATDLKQNFNFREYREANKEVIRKCRKEAFIHEREKRPVHFLGKNKDSLAK